MFGIVIDKETGLVLDKCVIVETYELKENEEVIEYEYELGNPVGSMNKPKWDGEKWIDTDPLPPVEVEPPQPSEIELLKQKVEVLEESQQVQDLLIDDIVFEVIPTLESQIGSQSNTIVLNNKLNLLNKIKGDGQAMAGYLAKKIIEGRDYATVFKTNSYKQYQDEVDTILELEGRGDLIKREVAYRG